MISVIIPTLNEEKLLPGLLKQLSNPGIWSGQEYEIIISDGGSTDSTLTIARAYNTRIIQEEQGKKGNIASGRNLGAEQARGNILVFINADIRFREVGNFFNYVRTNFASSEYGAMTCFVATFPEECKLIDRIFHSFYNNYFYVINKLGMGMGRGECQVIKTEVFRKTGGYLTHLVAGEDFDLFRRIAKIHKILYSRKFVVFESPRRYRKYGYFSVAMSWTWNAISVLRKNKSNSNTWEAVR
ncbi:MAG: glycosyltransferase [Ignavibacteria bacterium]|nr:glycosyltransferase [Ignavibacteria bacterium]